MYLKKYQAMPTRQSGIVEVYLSNKDKITFVDSFIISII